MSNVIQLSEYRQRVKNISSEAMRDGLVPLEVALAEADTEKCLQKLSKYGLSSVHVRSVKDYPSRDIYFVGLKEAIWVNKKILQHESATEAETTLRIDLIQMLENLDFTLMDRMWESIQEA
ncbi:MAG: hypothetical protein MI746_05695 [Pseudomonadales bacterium]|nr:hypothetical protein [Pseudomonadales bacterium]